jgi:hypothetical protein
MLILGSRLLPKVIYMFNAIPIKIPMTFIKEIGKSTVKFIWKHHIRWRKDSLFNKNCWENWLAVCKKLKLDPCISPYTSINSKWIKDLNIRPQTLNLIQETVGNILKLVSIGKNFLNGTPAAQQLSN